MPDEVRYHVLRPDEIVRRRGRPPAGRLRLAGRPPRRRRPDAGSKRRTSRRGTSPSTLSLCWGAVRNRAEGAWRQQARA